MERGELQRSSQETSVIQSAGRGFKGYSESWDTPNLQRRKATLFVRKIGLRSHPGRTSSGRWTSPIAFSREWAGYQFDTTAVKENAILSVENALADHKKNADPHLLTIRAD